MNGNDYNKIFLIIIFLLPFAAFSQTDLGLGDEDQAALEAAEAEDANEIKPTIEIWHLAENGAFIDSVRLDTTMDYFHIYNPIYQNGEVSVAYLGNYATPYQNNNFFERKSTFDFFFLRNRSAYLLSPEKVKYYNTRTPYTMLEFSQSEHRTRKNETRFNVLHSQNINPYLNVTFKFDQARSAGQYQNQATKNNFITLHSNYNKDNLRIHGGFISNSIKNNENGGLTNDDDILRNDDTEFLDVNLSNSRSAFGNMFAYVTGEYRIGRGGVNVVNEDSGEMEVEPFRPIFGIIYSTEYQSNKKEFIDQEESSNDFFPVDYYGEDYNKDSVRFRKVSNVFQLKQYENTRRRTSFGKRAFIGHELVKITSSEPRSFATIWTGKRYFNIFAGGGIFRQAGDFWRWNFDGKIYLLGRNTGQTELSGTISKPFKLLGDTATALTVNGKLENLVPDFFQEEYYSKHIRWNNNLKMEQRLTVGGSFQSPARNLEAGVNYALINNHIYNDTAGIPAQTSKELLVFSVYVDKDFNLNNLHFRTRALWQKVSDPTYIHLPEFSAFASAYYQFVVAKVLYAEVGVDARYNTAYYADAYNPATGLFHLQDDTRIGDFPYLDAHVNLRLKRTTVFFKMLNVGTEFIDKAYYTVPNYPMNRRTFRFGINWAFYD